jgi:hypothetical protein
VVVRLAFIEKSFKDASAFLHVRSPKSEATLSAPFTRPGSRCARDQTSQATTSDGGRVFRHEHLLSVEESWLKPVEPWNDGRNDDGGWRARSVASMSALANWDRGDVPFVTRGSET